MKGLLDKAGLFASAPFAIWIACMFVLPADSAWAYAARTVMAAAALVAAGAYFARREPLEQPFDPERGVTWRNAVWGLGAGVLVTVLWIAPEYIGAYRDWCILGDVPDPRIAQDSPYDPKVCGWPLTALRLAGSAFIIAPAEELFFRSYLYRRLRDVRWRGADPGSFDLSAFLWTTGLFALGHNRIVAAVMAGSVYLFVYMRGGFFAAALAHVVTNLLLALFVLHTGAWSFW